MSPASILHHSRLKECVQSSPAKHVDPTPALAVRREFAALHRGAHPLRRHPEVGAGLVGVEPVHRTVFRRVTHWPARSS